MQVYGCSTVFYNVRYNVITVRENIFGDGSIDKANGIAQVASMRRVR